MKFLQTFFLGAAIVMAAMASFDIDAMKTPPPRVERKPGIMGKIILQEDINDLLKRNK